MVSRTTALLGLGLLLGCTRSPEPTKPEPSPAASAALAMPGPSADGLSPTAQAGHRLYAVCHSCHDPELIPPKGPPMFGIQRRYKKATDDKAAFIQRMVTFVETPDPERAVMKPAVERMGLMPALPLGQAPLEQIAAYLYEADFPAPCAHWKFAIEQDAKDPATADDEHNKQDRMMYEKFCK